MPINSLHEMVKHAQDENIKEAVGPIDNAVTPKAEKGKSVRFVDGKPKLQRSSGQKLQNAVSTALFGGLAGAIGGGAGKHLAGKAGMAAGGLGAGGLGALAGNSAGKSAQKRNIIRKALMDASGEFTEEERKALREELQRLK